MKLEDRLFYVLQPPLETLLADSSLAFPFQPFAYQFEGVAFLYPRIAAVLADEMGLGKTMQAITAMRLLLHAGEIGSVLLVCPKPLVTNWQREFALWAPEMPVTVIEGDQARRRWQWQLPDAPVKIANYELLQRDRRLLAADPSLEFDLVVLDEVAADQEPPQHDQPGGALDRPPPQLGADRHASRKQSRRPGGHFRVRRARAISSRDMKPRTDGSGGERLRAAAHQGQGAHRAAPQDCFATPSSS